MVELEYIISADLVFYGLMAGAVIVLRHKAPLIERPYRTLAYPYTPAIYIVVATLLIFDLAYVAPQPQERLPIDAIRNSGVFLSGAAVDRALVRSLLKNPQPSFDVVRLTKQPVKLESFFCARV